MGNNILISSCDIMIIIIMDKLTITSSTGILLAVSDYATLSDDVTVVVADGLLRTAVLGLEILGDVVADTLLSDELAGNFLLSCTNTTFTILQIIYYSL